MSRHVVRPQILVIADDFTGGNDAGVSLALTGMTVNVAFTLPCADDADVLVINTDSRALEAEQAAARVSELALTSQAGPQTQWLKKIDSTLRGNPGAELDALMRITGKKRAIVALACPSVGRTTEQGQCLVNGIPVTQTEFASDPKTPVMSADICEVIQAQTTIACRAMSLNDYMQHLREPAVETPQIWVVDARTDADLDVIVTDALMQDELPLLVGSAGICDALARHVRTPSSQCLLAVVGSMSEIAQQQIAAVYQDPQVGIFIDIENIFSGSSTEYAQHIVRILSSGRHCIVHTSPDSEARHHIPQLCVRMGMNRAQLGEKICQFLGQLIRQVLQEVSPGALYLSGGDVAMAVADALKATGFRITDRVAQCVPYGHFVGGDWQRPVMTKAGGFGDETTLRQVLNFIEENMSE
ncbi:D-threonate kinase [Citrobacter youngae]|uniref:D-threonate kinase n=1 Tax=Citrobacter youngae TaxID=133448 RepID=UPI002B2345BB|nr:four-carbon acid sugar kinase family protein [Citrobacter youngae]MEB1032812.1 four-carbon acid sugar kinase family protein [Citrobacter youngae]